MTHAVDLPFWAALPVALLLLLGAGLALTGSLGLLRLGSFYERVHAPTLGTTLGIGCVLIASMLAFSVLQTRPVLHEVLIGVFVTITTPVALMLLARAALYRDRHEGSGEMPQPGGCRGGRDGSPETPAVHGQDGSRR
ncbi:MAG: cation:proton antiporter [Acetobacteraceae bacterium]|nr:cation:proton antiporter [Acetobacteraceae bacterium]